MRWRVEKTEHFQKQVLGLTDTLWSSLLSFARGYDNGSPGLRHFAVWAMVFAVFVPMVRSLWLLYLWLAPMRSCMLDEVSAGAHADGRPRPVRLARSNHRHSLNQFFLRVVGASAFHDVSSVANPAALRGSETIHRASRFRCSR